MRKGFFWVKDSKKNEEKSTSEKTVFTTPHGKEFEKETPHGRFKRFKKEIESGVHSVTGEVLSPEDLAYRKGVVNTMGEQVRIWKKKHGNN